MQLYKIIANAEGAIRIRPDGSILRGKWLATQRANNKSWAQHVTVSIDAEKKYPHFVRLRYCSY